MIQFSDCYVEPGQRYSMISETLPNWGGLKVENFGGKFKFQNLSSWNTLFSTLGGDEITFSGFIWGQELITKCPCWVKLHITEDNFCHFFKPPQFRFFLSKNVKLFEAIRSPLGTTTIRIETPDANANNGGLLVNCINDMCKDDDTKDYNVEYYDELVSFREAALPSSKSDSSIRRIIKK